MSMEQDANILGNLTVGDTNDPDQPPIQDANPVDGALNASNVDLIDQLVVDFSQVERAQEMQAETEETIDTVRRTGEIGQLTTAALENHLGPLKDRFGCKVQVTAAPSGLNLKKALESATAALDAKRLETSAAIAKMVEAASALRGQLEARKQEFDKRSLEFAATQAAMAETFGTTFLPQILNDLDWEFAVDMTSPLKYASLYLDESYPEAKPIADDLRKVRTNTSYQSALLCLVKHSDCMHMGGRSFNLYNRDDVAILGEIEDDSTSLAALLDLVGTKSHSIRAQLTFSFGMAAVISLVEAAEAAAQANKDGDVTSATQERLFNQARQAVQLLSEANMQLKALLSLFDLAGQIVSYAFSRHKESAARPAIESSRVKRQMRF